MSARYVILSTGVVVELDGNVDALVEAVYDEIIVKGSQHAEMGDLASEFSFVLSQMKPEDRDRYLFVCLGTLVELFHREMHSDLAQGEG